MKTNGPIVTYREIHRALRGDVNALMRTAESTRGTRGPSDRAANAAMLAQLSHALQLLEQDEKRPGVMVAVKDPMASLLQTLLTKKGIEAGRVEELPTGTREVKFDEHDILGWVGSFLFDWWKGIRKRRFVKPSPEPEKIANGCRMALFADWGTGRYGAPAIQQSIQNDAKGYQSVIHLGDVYYAGDNDEMRENCLDLWPQAAGAVHRAANANHEMYTGGHAYFNELLPRLQQKSSAFAFQNDFWTIVGLDTAHQEHDLGSGQAAWLDGILSMAGNRKVILLSHHQPFSLLDSQGPKLVAKLGNLLEGRRIFAWYWGHEHRCVLYDQHAQWGFYGRCIGHGGYPYFREGLGPVPVKPEWKRLDGKNFVPAGLLLDGPNPYVRGYEKDFGPHGYLTVELQDGHLNEVVHDADGTVLREQPLS